MGRAWWATPMWREQAERKWARCGISIVAWCDSGNLSALAALPFQSQQSGALARMWRWCQVKSSQKSGIGGGYCKNERILLQPLSWPCFESVVFACPMHENDQRWTCTVIGLKSCDISVYCWIWMLSFLLKHNGIGNDYFLLNFVTFVSVLGVQITVTFGSVWDCRLL